MKIMVLDFESSNLPDWKQPSEAPQQPHICEVCAIKYDEQGNELDRFHAFVKPDGWEINVEAQKAHGYTVDFLTECGRPEQDVVRDFMTFADDADIRVGHNESFDARIMRIALKRFAPVYVESVGDVQTQRDTIADRYRDRTALCTMRLATPICAIEATDKMKSSGMRFKHKNPTLAEAHAFFIGVPLEGAHGAIADTQGCARVFFHMVKKGFITLPQL